ncbi:poly-gamma-glutamate hydrolase family protein [Aliidiomarina minuta]
MVALIAPHGAGVQLELSRGLRSTFFESLNSAGRRRQTHVFHQFVDAVRQGLVRAGLL